MENAVRRAIVGLLPDLAQIFPQIARRRERLVQTQGLLTFLAFALGVIQRVGTFQQQSAESLEDPPAPPLGFSLELTSQPREHVIHQLHDGEVLSFRPT